MDCSPPGSLVHGILQAVTLEWVAISFTRGSSWPRDRTRVCCIGRLILYTWATRVTRYENWHHHQRCHIITALGLPVLASLPWSRWSWLPVNSTLLTRTLSCKAPLLVSRYLLPTLEVAVRSKGNDACACLYVNHCQILERAIRGLWWEETEKEWTGPPTSFKEKQLR